MIPSPVAACGPVDHVAARAAPRHGAGTLCLIEIPLGEVAARISTDAGVHRRPGDLRCPLDLRALVATVDHHDLGIGIVGHVHDRAPCSRRHRQGVVGAESDLDGVDLVHRDEPLAGFHDQHL